MNDFSPCNVSVQEAPLPQDLPRAAAEGAGGGELPEPRDPDRGDGARHPHHPTPGLPSQVRTLVELVD